MAGAARFKRKQESVSQKGEARAPPTREGGGATGVPQARSVDLVSVPCHIHSVPEQAFFTVNHKEIESNFDRRVDKR